MKSTKITYLLICIWFSVMLVFGTEINAFAQDEPQKSARDKKRQIPATQPDIDPRNVPIVVFKTPRLSDASNLQIQERLLVPVVRQVFQTQYNLLGGNAAIPPTWRGPQFQIGFVTEMETVGNKNLVPSRKGILARVLGELGVQVAEVVIDRVPTDGQILGSVKDRARTISAEFGKDWLGSIGLGRNGDRVIFAVIPVITRGVDGSYKPITKATQYLEVRRTDGRLGGGGACFELTGRGTSPTNIVQLKGKDNPKEGWGCTADALVLGINELMFRELIRQGGDIRHYLEGRREADDNKSHEVCDTQDLGEDGRWTCVHTTTVQPKYKRRVLGPNNEWVYVDVKSPTTTNRSTQTVSEQANPNCKGDPVCVALGASPISSQPTLPAPKPTPTPTPVQPPTPPANVPADSLPNLGHTGRPGFAGFTPTTDLGEGSEAARKALGFFCVGSGDAWFTAQWKPLWAFRVNGPMMTKSISDFQLQNSLTVNGQLDVPTRLVLNKIWKLNPRMFPDMAQLATQAAPCKVK